MAPVDFSECTEFALLARLLVENRHRNPSAESDPDQVHGDEGRIARSHGNESGNGYPDPDSAFGFPDRCTQDGRQRVSRSNGKNNKTQNVLPF